MMADKAFEADDPYELVAHSAPLLDARDKDEMMARCFVEEFAMMGVPADRILHLFRSRAFVGTNSILEKRGEAFITDIVQSVFGSAATRPPTLAQDDRSPTLPFVSQHQCADGTRKANRAPSGEEAPHGHGL